MANLAPTYKDGLGGEKPTEIKWETVISSSTPTVARILGGYYLIHAVGTFGPAQIDFKYAPAEDANAVAIVDPADAPDGLHFDSGSSGCALVLLPPGWIIPVNASGDGTTDVDLRVIPVRTRF